MYSKSHDGERDVGKPGNGRSSGWFFTIRGAKYPKGVEFMTMFRDGWE